MTRRRAIIVAILMPLCTAALLNSHLTDLFAAKIVGELGWHAATQKALEYFTWSSFFFFLAFRAIPFIGLSITTIIIHTVKPHWYWRFLITGILITGISEIYWTWDLSAAFYREGHISSTHALGYLVSPIFVGFTQTACAIVTALTYFVYRKTISMKHQAKWIAGILSLLFPGLGQLYNNQLIKSGLFATARLLVIILAYRIGWPQAFQGFCRTGIALVIVVLAALVDAIWNAGPQNAHHRSSRWYIYIAVVLSVFTIEIAFTPGSMSRDNTRLGITSYHFPGVSMLPTLQSDETFIADGRPLVRTGLQRGDVLVFRNRTRLSGLFVKRLIGLPGDHIRTAGTEIFINDKQIEHTVTDRQNDITTMTERIDNAPHIIQYSSKHTYPDKEYVVSDDQVFIMGDNRDNSADSREFGPISIKSIVGKGRFILFPKSPHTTGESIH